MAVICQKSVCVYLAQGIVKRKIGYLQGQDTKAGWYLDPDGDPEPIVYCPYCGTHLIEIHHIPPIQRTRRVLLPVAPVEEQQEAIMHDLAWMPPPPPENWKDEE